MHELLVRQRLTMLYLDRGCLEQDGHSLVLAQGRQATLIPVGATAVLMLGPGVSVTHAAITLCAKEKTLLLWVGEMGVRVYGAANATGDGAALLAQAQCVLDAQRRLHAARIIYRQMFNEPAHPRYSIEQIRGAEGAKVRRLYEQMAQEHGIVWPGRSAGLTNPLNRALAGVNAALYGLTEAVILAYGCSPSMGIVHSGDPRSFVFDLADTVKFQSVTPIAFKLAAEHGQSLDEGMVRRTCRDAFGEGKIAGKLFDNLQEILNANAGD